MESLPPTLCPCANVRRSCRMVMADTAHVSIQTSKLDQLARDITSSGVASSPIEWDVEQWHYTAPEYKGDQRTERVLLYILALDAINFCFWPAHGNSSGSSGSSTGHGNVGSRWGSNTSNKEVVLEYEHLALALTALAKQEDPYFFSPTNLSLMTPDKMQSSLSSSISLFLRVNNDDEQQQQQNNNSIRLPLPNIAERCRLWNELGHVLLAAPFHGNVLHLLHLCQRDGPRLVQTLIQYIPGFRDESMYHGKWVAFYKRAQIAVGDINAALQLDLSHMDQLTTFADYRIPQLLRHLEILEYSEVLSAQVDGRNELTNGSEEEVSIRAATVVVVEELVERLKEGPMTAVQLDWYLWQVGEKLNGEGVMKPHHCVNTIFY